MHRSSAPAALLHDAPGNLRARIRASREVGNRSALNGPAEPTNHPATSRPHVSRPDKPSLDGLERRLSRSWTRTVPPFDRPDPGRRLRHRHSSPRVGALHVGHVFSYTQPTRSPLPPDARESRVLPMCWDETAAHGPWSELLRGRCDPRSSTELQPPTIPFASINVSPVTSPSSAASRRADEWRSRNCSAARLSVAGTTLQ